MKVTTDDDGAWWVETAGGHIGERAIEPDRLGPLPDMPRLLMRWSEIHTAAGGAGHTTYTRLESGAVAFTLRAYRWVPDRPGGETVRYETVLRDHASGELLNPDPPETSVPDRWSPDGWQVLE
jgi:hypothetical protein